MSKSKALFSCQQCGTVYPKWTGQCSGCAEWNTIVEEIAAPPASQPRFTGYAGIESSIIRMADVLLKEDVRLSSGSSELDRVLGGGLIMGSAILIGGDPGIGKSTLLLQTAAQLSQQLKVLYVTGEESPQQITLRARRLGVSQEVLLLAETQIETILQKAKAESPRIIVIDSIQTMYTGLLASAPGSVGQVRESAMQLVNYAKKTGTSVFLVGHVTKEGHLAGPRVLEHMVDTVLYFEGEQDSRYRLIRAVKNRFGAANELGIFAMTEKGLKEVNHPSAIFLSRGPAAVPGSIITATQEGTRPILVEVQALVDETHLPSPRRLAVGLESPRLSLLLAILHRHANLSLHHVDIFLNVVGGLQIVEPAADLPALFAILSSFKNRALPQDLLSFGEVGLNGEIRPVPSGQERLKAAAKHGFKIVIGPQSNHPQHPIEGLVFYAVNNLKEALNYFDELAANAHS